MPACAVTDRFDDMLRSQLSALKQTYNRAATFWTPCGAGSAVMIIHIVALTAAFMTIVAVLVT
jgi:hypothetical protein